MLHVDSERWEAEQQQRAARGEQRGYRPVMAHGGKLIENLFAEAENLLWNPEAENPFAIHMRPGAAIPKYRVGRAAPKP